MKRLFLILVLVISFNACSSLKNIKHPVVYGSLALPLGQYWVQVIFYPDSTFEYILIGVPERIKGGWELKRDTIILYSDKFYEESILGGYQYKYTKAEAGKDVYIMKGKYLYELEPKKFKSLKKTSKKYAEKVLCI